MRRDIFQAIADPTRRAIIAKIVNQPMTPRALSEQFDSSRQAVSKHIRILSECGLVTLTQSGRERFYTIHPNKLKAVDEWLAPFRQLWDGRFENLDQVLTQLQTKQHDKRKSNPVRKRSRE